MKAVIFTGLVSVDKNLVGTSVIYKKIADILLCLGYQVDMVVPRKEEMNDGARHHTWEEKNNERLIDRAKIVIFGAYPPIEPMYYAYQKKKIILTYLWSVAPIGSMEFKDFSGVNKQRQLHQYITASYNLSLLMSDKIFCRNEEVRKLILGSLFSLGRIDLKNYYKDRTLNGLVEASPFGIEKKTPVHKKNVYRGVIKGIDDNDFLLIWNGGIWNWNDGEVLMQIMKLIRDKYKRKNIKLILQGFKHPDKDQKLSKEAKKTLDLAEKFKLSDKNVFFVKHWVPYNERGNYLVECDAGIVTSPDIPEANFFLKTRIYDYLWADLPVVIGDNEAFASFVKKMNLGVVSSCGQASDWAEQIVRLAEDKDQQEKIKNNIRSVKKEMTWDKTLRGIQNFLLQPQKDEVSRLKDKELLLNNIKNNIDIIRRGL